MIRRPRLFLRDDQNPAVSVVPDAVRLAMPETAPAQESRTQARTFQFACKRALDLLVAGALLLALSPVAALIALAIALDSRGPIIIGQVRVGRGGRRFRMYKFRSMVNRAESLKAGLVSDYDEGAPLFKMRDDPRRTRVGRLLRRLSLDELPQLLNVVRGDMSLVGPRPPLPEEVETYTPFQMQRLHAVPGMTGLWQVSGRSLLTFDQMLELDLCYIRAWSFWLDLRILLRTIPVVLSGKGAY